MMIQWYEILNYTEENVRKIVKKSGGNYIILAKIKGKDYYEPRYVGLAEDLEVRLLDHLSHSEPNEKLRNLVGNKVVKVIYAYVGREDDRKNVEYTLYQRYDASRLYNEQVPEGRLIDINFPI